VVMCVVCVPGYLSDLGGKSVVTEHSRVANIFKSSQISRRHTNTHNKKKEHILCNTKSIFSAQDRYRLFFFIVFLVPGRKRWEKC
jgi:hypothetical protein